ncbi:hypothetical protein [Curtobacterium sp. CFBP9011]|uniref:hypothetical protein n=1 Tax=Curtobacterium sp. CFBP9011 TaxID=3096530 RepID=UPI002A6A5D72|nr:hypothetical protein [Curtobacterium sp. CFBP9011]MDY1005453.1 hypothetical protein [Curtobacterium sp. CFBP9011]
MAKKKTVGKLGAGVLAATTVISGLGFGIMPAGAATETKASSTHENGFGEEGATFQLIAEQTEGYAYLSDRSPAEVRLATTIEEAKRNAVPIKATFSREVDGVDYWQLRVGTQCLTSSQTSDTTQRRWLVDTKACTTFSWKPQEWTVDSGTLKSAGNTSYYAPLGETWLPGNLTRTFGNPSSLRFNVSSVPTPVVNPFVDLPATLVGLSADVQDVDLEAGTALLDGVAPDEATDVEVSYLDKDSKKKTYNAAAKDGKWSQALSALALGNTSVHLKAYNGAELIAESDVDVDLPVTPLSVQPELSDANVEAVAKLTGSASKNTTIKVKSGTKQVATTMTGEDGSFEVPVNAPNAAGDYELTATQEIRDEDATPQDVTIPYGAGVAVSSPENGAELDAGQPLVVSGTAQTNSLIRVYEKGNPRVVLGQATATNGYRIVLNDLEDREYQLVVAGVSKGNNVTTAEVTVNPGKSQLDAPTAEGYFPEAVSEWAGIAGIGAMGSTVIAHNTDGDEVGRTTITEPSGLYNIGIDPSKVGYGDQEFLVTQSTGSSVSPAATVHLDYGQNAPAFTTPSEGSSIPNSPLRFTGTGNEGGVVQVRGVDLTEVGTASVEDGTWEITNSDITLPNGGYQLWVNQRTKGGKIEYAQLNVTVTSPTAAAPTAEGYFPSNVSEWAGIAGIGTPGATVIARDANDDEIGRTTITEPSGLYNIGIDPTKVGYGDQEFSITQQTGEQVSAATTVRLDYGQNAPAFTTPSEGTSIPGSPLRFTGTGNQGGVVQVRGVDFTEVGTASVEDGTWEITNSDITLPDGGYQFWVNQRTKGGKIEYAPVNVHVAPPVTAKPTAEGYFPEDDAQWAGIAGIGTPGATVIAHDTDGDEIGRTTITEPSGLYNIGIDPTRVGYGDQEFSITQQLGEQVSEPTTVNLDYGQEGDLAFTSPTGGTITGTGPITFRGTALADSLVTVTGTDFTSDSVFGSTTATDGNWELTTALDLPAGPYQFWARQLTKGGKYSYTNIGITITG